jgi:Putative Ig domain
MRRLATLLALSALVAVVAISSALAFGFTDDSFFPPTGVVGKPYPNFAFKIKEGGGCPPYTFHLQSGTFPPGLSLSTDTGAVTGTPTQAGSFSFWLEALDSSYPGNCNIDPSGQNKPGCATDPWPPCRTQREFTIKVDAALSIDQQSLGATLVNAPYNVQLTASGGGTQTWSLDSGALPLGIFLSPTGLLSGTPTVVGSYPFVVKVVDNNLRSDTETLTLTVVAPLTATAPTPLPKAEVSRAFVLSPIAAGGTAPYVWALTQGTLPLGLALDAATGKIAGIPTAAGQTSLVLTVTDANGFTTTLPLTLDVKAKLTIATKRLKPARVGQLYRARVKTVGGQAPYRWRISGKLPAGIRFNTRTGAFSGVARRAGRYQATVRVVDSLGVVSKQALVITVLR